jgi:hypothetical protein
MAGRKSVPVHLRHPDVAHDAIEGHLRYQLERLPRATRTRNDLPQAAGIGEQRAQILFQLHVQRDAFCVCAWPSELHCLEDDDGGVHIGELELQLAADDA